MESKLEKSDELELYETVYKDRLRHLTPKEGLERRYGADYLNTLRSGTSAAQLMTLWTHEQDGGLYAGDNHAHQDLLAVWRHSEDGTKQDYALDEIGLGKAAAAQKSQPSPEGVGGGPENPRSLDSKLIVPETWLPPVSATKGSKATDSPKDPTTPEEENMSTIEIG